MARPADARILRRHRMGGHAALVERQSRLARRFLSCDQAVAGRGAAAAASRGDDPVGGNVRPLPRLLSATAASTRPSSSGCCGTPRSRSTRTAMPTAPIATASPARSRPATALDPLLLPGNLANCLETGLQHPFDDAYYKQRTPLAQRIEVPFLSAGNWGGLGLHLRGNVEAFEQAASQQKWLEMHDRHAFRLDVSASGGGAAEAILRHFLKGEDNGLDKEPPVLLTVRDPRGLFRRKESEWPLARTEWTRYYLDAADVSLGDERAGGARKVEYDAHSDGVTFRRHRSPPGHRIHRAGRGEAVRASSTSRHGSVPHAACIRSGRQRSDLQGRERSTGAGIAGLAARLAAQARSEAVAPLPALSSARRARSWSTRDRSTRSTSRSGRPRSSVPDGLHLALTIGGKDFNDPTRRVS